MSQTRTARDRLVVERMSQTMTEKGFAGAMENLTTPAAIGVHMRMAKAFVDAAIFAVRSAKDFDPTWDEEKICQMILDGLAERKAARKA